MYIYRTYFGDPPKMSSLCCTDMIQVLIGPATHLGPAAQLVWEPVYAHWINLMMHSFPIRSAIVMLFNAIVTELTLCAVICM